MIEHSRSNTRITLETVTGLAKVQNINIMGFVRNPQDKSVAGIIIGLSKPISESEIKGVTNG